MNNTLIMAFSSDINRTLVEHWAKSRPEYPNDLHSYLLSLDGVKDVSYQIGGRMLIFETEQDKMFFLLKYS